MKELGTEEWAELLSAKRAPSKERVIITGKFARDVRIAKDDWREHFAGFGGIGFKRGKEIEIVAAESGGQKADIPERAKDHLASVPGYGHCTMERGGRHYILRALKRLGFLDRLRR